jgi:predicted AlkP superfamily phosphohydrolase/phosphomutase
MARPRLMLLGLDSFEPTLLDEWCRDGTLPNLAALREQGANGVVHSCADQLPGAVWPSFAAMSDPSHHGVWEFMQWDPKAMRSRRPTPEWLDYEPFWHMLGKKGVATVALDIPFEFAKAAPGPVVEVHGWGLHDEMTAPFSNPRPLLNEIRERHGRSPMRPDVLGPKKTETLQKELRGILTSVRRRVGIIEELARANEWQVLIAPFAETHRVSHWYWTERSTGTPLEGVRRVARAIDREIPRIRALLGPEDVLVVFSLHGMGPTQDVDRFNDAMWDYFEPGDATPARRFDPVRLANRSLPPYLRRRLSASLPTHIRDRLLSHALVAGRDWTKVKLIFPMPDGRLFVRFNQRGREVAGTLDPAERPAAVERLRSTLMGAVNESGEPVFRAVEELAERFSGPRLDMLPDLVAQIHQRPIGDVITMPDGRQLRAPWRGWRDGDHRPAGFYIVVGPGAERGSEAPAVAGHDVARMGCERIGITL